MGAELLAALADLLGPGGLLTERADFAAYEQGWRYGQGRALAVARPGSTEAVSQVLALCHAQGVRVIAQGANTGLVGASVPDAGGAMLVLSLERLNRRLAIDPVDRTVLVDGGVLLSALNRALAEHGLWFPVDLGADPQIGGMVATNTAGTRLLRHGDVRRNLLGLEVVLADGRVVDGLSALRKDNTGLGLAHLFTGTSGLFGVVTGAVLNVAPLPRQRMTAWVALADGAAALGLLQALERGVGELLSAYEVMSAEALGAVYRHQERLRNPLDGIAPYTALVEVASALPREALDLESVLGEALAARMEAPGSGLLDAALDAGEAFWEIRHHISESLRAEGRVLGFDLAVPRSRLAAFTDAVKARLAAEHPQVRVCDFGHWGDGGTHLNLVWDPAQGGADAVSGLQDLVYGMAVRDFRGSFSAEHGVGPHNQRIFDRHAAPAARAAAAALKAHFDPGGLLGTGRLW